MTEIKIDQFQGPLDLLLQLIEQEKMNITDVSLSKVTEQYLEHLEKISSASGEDRSSNLADFLVIATKLVYLKSKNILPYLYPPEEDDGPSLSDQLKLYKQYLEASKQISALWEADRVSYGRIEPPVKTEGFVLPANALQNDLHDVMLKLVKRLQPLRPLARMSVDKSVSIKQKIESLKNLIKQFSQLNFEEVLNNAHNKTEIIVSFLAVLELCRERTVHVAQDEIYGRMIIKKV